MKKLNLNGWLVMILVGLTMILSSGTAFAAGASSANYAIPSDVISSGGGTSTSSGYINTGVIGQGGPVGPTDPGGSYLAFSGYLYTTPAATDDPDADGIIAIVDNCPNTANANQADINTNGIGDACDDSDADGVTDAEEFIIGTNYTNPDTDADGVTDGDEVAALTDPLVPDNGDPVLTGSYHTGMFGDDQYGLGGEIQLERMLLILDGTVKGTYLSLIDKDGQSGQTWPFYYNPAPDNTFVVESGDKGQISNDGNVILFTDANVVDPLDTMIAINIGGKQGSGLDNTLLSGNYIGAKLHNFDEPVSSAMAISLNQLNFDGSSNVVKTTLVNSEGFDESGSESYSVASDGTLTLTAETGFATVDGELLMVTDTTIDPDISMTFAVRQGSDMSAADLAGDFFYQELTQDVTDNNTENLIFTVTFDGTGKIAIDSLQTSDGGLIQGVSDYTVDADGNLLIVGAPSGILSANGEYFVLADTVKGDNDIAAGIGIKKPAATLDSDGDGLTNFEELQIGSDPFLVDTDADTINDDIDNCPTVANTLQEDGDADGIGDACDNCALDFNPNQSDLNLDGEGDVCDIDSDFDADTVFDAFDNCPSVANAGQEDTNGDGIGDACTAVPPVAILPPASSDVGSFRFYWNSSDTPGAEYVLEYSQNASAWIPGYTGSNNYFDTPNFAPATYLFRVKATKAGLADSPWVMSSNCIVNPYALPPAAILPPANSDVGSFRFYWNTSGTPGVEYVLEYSQNASSWMPAYTGPNNYFDTPDYAPATYLFRVKATKAGLADSPWVMSSNCIVNPYALPPAAILPPANSDVGSFRFYWNTSGTPGVEYVLEYSQNASSWMPAYTGPNNYFDTPDYAPATYLFRVKATKAGLADSPWVMSSDCIVNPYALPPAAILPPANSDVGSFRFYWNTSGTPGVEYVLEYSQNASSWMPAYTGPNNYFDTPDYAPATYLFRVKATKAGLADSPWVMSSDCIVNPYALPPASIQPPANSDVGSFRFYWNTSGTPGVEYVLEYSQNASSWMPAYTGPNNYFDTPDYAPATYLFRVKATKAGLADSPWVMSSDCVVQ